METRKRVSVSFQGDDDVLQHIVPINETKKPVKQSRASSSRSNKRVSIAPQEDLGADDQETEDDVFKPSNVLAEADAVSGSEVYGFKTPKKSGSMTLKASESAQCTPRTPTTVGTPTSSRTPKSILKRSSAYQETGQTPVRKRGKVRQLRLATKTPQRLRARNPQTAADSSGSSSEDSLGSDDDDSSSDNETGGVRASSLPGTPTTATRKQHEAGTSTPRGTRKVAASADTPTRVRDSAPSTPTSLRRKQSKPSTPSTAPATPSAAAATPATKRRRRQAKEADETVKTTMVEDYFSAQAGGRTSDHTLARLETPRMDQEALNEALEGAVLPYSKERAALFEEYRQNFDRWMYMLCSGYNLLCHGLGSKRDLLEEFTNSHLANFNHLVINGYFPSLTIKSILNGITEDILDHNGSFRNPLDQVDFIKKYYETEDESLFLVVHNLDGPMLRSEKAQTVLSTLAASRNIHVAASVDHINAPLIWDQSRCSRFHFLWLDVTTYAPYVEETAYENSLLVSAGGGALALSSLTHVMRSLTPNARGIFFLLVKYQLEHADDGNYNGLAFPDLYQKCREAFLVNSDLTLRTQLTEFRDHKLIKTRKNFDGVEYLTVPLDAATLKEFLDSQEDS